MVVCEVRDPIDVFGVQRSIVAEAGSVGFARRACTELAIVGSELTSNILKYGVRGSIEIARIDGANGRGLSLVAGDLGPPFRDLEAALKDGWDDQGPIDPLHMHRRKGIGGGLGAIVRLTHSFRVEPLAKGKRIHVLRYVTAPRAGIAR